MSYQTSEVLMDSMCHCGRNAVKKTSWTDLNPGRRYSACENFREVGGCCYFVWIDPPMCTRARQIIPGLLKKVNKLENNLKQVNKLENDIKQLEDDLKCKRSREKYLWFALVMSWSIMYLFM
ncbi:hypothetical protein DH2020_025570 [Rehmannia glutinosa]|uniref:GRF-type domain-containing protein n=1 Tax=Rehmannia glutinosa TaxID=99300 RepID=A0ABR0W1R6_REHGL